MKHALRIALGVALAASLGACSLPGDREPPRLFVLSAKSTFNPNLPKVNWQLAVDTPIAEAGHSTSKIALRHDQFELEYFARAAWTDVAPQMIQALLIVSFENTGKIVGVGRQSVALRGDYLLVTEVRDFQAEYDGKTLPNVHVKINAKLVQMPRRVIVANHTEESIQPAANGSLGAVVEAFDELLGKVLKRTVEWCLTAVPPERPSPTVGD